MRGPWNGIVADGTASDDPEPALAAPPAPLAVGGAKAIRFSLSASADDKAPHKFLNTSQTPFGANAVVAAETEFLFHGPVRHVNIMTMVLGTNSGSAVTYVSFVIDPTGISLVVGDGSSGVSIPGGALPSDHWAKLSFSVRLPAAKSGAPLLTVYVNDVAVRSAGGTPLPLPAYDFFQLSLGPDYAEKGDVVETWNDNAKLTLAD